MSDLGQRVAESYDARVQASGRDRTVHGLATDGREIVRYDKAGKWYTESRITKRTLVTLGHATNLAAMGTAFLDRPGGQQFDAKVRKIRKAVSQ